MRCTHLDQCNDCRARCEAEADRRDAYGYDLGRAKMATAIESACAGESAVLEELARLTEALTAARHQLVAAFGILRSHASDEHVQHYQRAMMLCDAVLAKPAAEPSLDRDTEARR